MQPISHARFISLLELQHAHAGQALLADGSTVSVHEDISENWKFYSKAWHRAHGPKRTVERRWVRLTTPAGQRHELDIPAFRGNYLLTALAQLLGLKKVRVSRGLAPAQLFTFAQVELQHRRGEVAVYARTFAGTRLDYVIVALGKTYHAETVAAAVAGWKNKECRRQARQSEVLTYELVREQYGFCHEGIADFCELNGLDIEAAYTRQQVRNAALPQRAANCRRFAAELRTVGITLSC